MWFNRTTFNKNWKSGYRKWCSPKCAQSDKSTKEKRKLTVIEKYGVDNISKLEETKIKQEKTNLEKWGHKSTFQNREVQERWKKSVKDKWGVEHVFQLKVVKDKSRKTSLEKWGVSHFVQSDKYKEKLEDIGFSNKIRERYIKKHFEKYSEIGLEFISIENRILTLNGQCGHSFSIHYDSLKRRIENGYEYCTTCNPINSGQSQEEKIIIDWLRELEIEIIERDKSLGIELDIFIPSLNIAIEYNGLYWHSELYKDNKYHLNKTEICNKNGIRLIHIWEDDWLYKKEIIKSILLNSFKLNKNKIFARKCKLVLVDTKVKNNFLDKNHIQGKCQSSINIGLEYNGELVSLMTFGGRNINTKKEFEIIRFCNKINTNVVGSASKLFKYFLENYKYEDIVSYADVSHFTGELYKNLGFNYSHRSEPNYWWVVDGNRHHRFKYNKKRLVKEGANTKMTEVEIMYKKGYFRIFGCGQDKYIY
jgi:flagellar hook protein FlgE